MMGRIESLTEVLMPHLIVAPILLPLLTACGLLFIGERQHRTKVVLGLLALLANLGVAVLLLLWSTWGNQPSAYGVYLPSNWDVPYGIVLVVDRLSALMLVTAALVALMAFLFAAARWHKAGAHFKALFLFQVMGLNGAFLTGDLFNLFVFFEVMLAASYGLVLHGSADCAEVNWTLLGMSIPEWSLLAFAGMVLFAGYQLLRRA